MANRALKEEDRRSREYGAARIYNFLEDKGIEVSTFAAMIGINDKRLGDCLREQGGSRLLGEIPLHRASVVMGISYERLIAPLTDADYATMEVAG